jgi:nonsense-mediated mRNA decay protein 3
MINVPQADVEFVVSNRQCSDCIRQASAHTWRSVVQVRQRVDTKRSLAFLEQTLIANKMHKNLIDLQVSYLFTFAASGKTIAHLLLQHATDGVDLFFSDKNHSQHVVQFLSSRFPVRTHAAKKLVSSDLKNNTHTHQFTTIVEMVPLMKDVRP